MTKNKLFLIIVTCLFSYNLVAQKGQIRVCQCAKKSEGAIGLRDFTITVKQKENALQSGKRFKLELRKDIVYRFYICDFDNIQDSFEMRLFKTKKEEFTSPLCISQQKQNDTYGFDYQCSETGTYWLSLRHKVGRKVKNTSVVGIMSLVNYKKIK